MSLAQLVFADLENNLPKKLVRSRKRPNASGIDFDYVKKIGAQVKGGMCWKTDKFTKTGRPVMVTSMGILIESITFGFTRRRFEKNGPIVNRIANKKYPKVYKHLKKVAATIFPTFGYDSICLNHNFKCLPHKDKNNRGESIIVGFGNYQGGELNIGGTDYDIRHKPIKFDGKKVTHFVKEFQGERWTAVYFKSTVYDKMDPSQKVIETTIDGNVDGVKRIKQ
jgi:hypothetical protein